jgi:hypothetical protein
VVVAVDGTGPAQVAGGRLSRLLRGLLLACGLSALTWLLTTLAGPGTAAAESAPPGQGASTQSSGLLGGLLGTVGGVLNTATTAVGQLTGAVLDTVPPVRSDPPPAPEIPLPQQVPAPIDLPAAARSSPHVIIQVERPAPVAAPTPAPVPVPSPPPVAPVARKPATAPVPVVAPRPEPIGTEQVDPSSPSPAPGKGPTVPPVPASCTSGAHDGPGGTHGVLAGQAGIEPPAEAHTMSGRAGDAGDRSAGLPAASPG